MAFLGAGLIFSSAAALNHLLEVSSDALMERTKYRPLPTQKVSKQTVVVIILLTLILGSIILYFKTNLLVLISSLLTFVFYDFVYTPLKKITHFNTFIGALPGAMPVFCGWFIFHESLNLSILMVFAILFFWQLPHFYSIAWMNKDGYKSANLKMISVNDKDGKRTTAYLFWTTIFFIIVSYLPVYFGLFKIIYFVGISVIHCILLASVISFVKEKTVNIAKKVLISTILYPQAIVLFVIFDKLWL